MKNGDITVLVIEDDEQLQFAYKAGFEAFGLNVLQAFNAKQTMEILKVSKPNVILMDVLMPEINGKELLAKLKKMPKVKSIPVLITSNSVKEEDIKETKALGADEYIVKSNISIEDLINKVKKFASK
ncbi:response regulator [Patescibacteria group bacterium]